KVEGLEQDKVAQAIEIIKLKQRVRLLEKKRKLKLSGLKKLRKVGTAQRVESSTDTVMNDQKDASKHKGIIVDLDADKDVILEEVDAAKDAEVEKNADVQGRLEQSQAQVYHINLEHADKVLRGRIAKIDADKDVILEEVDDAKDAEVEKNADVQGRLEESQAQVYHIDLEHDDKVLSMQDDEPEPTELKEVIEVVTTVKMTEVVTAATGIITATPSAARRRK
nr:hypothetical protein [Tanacetum cinerariifolium]